MTSFQRIGVMSRKISQPVVETLVKLVGFLDQRGHAVVIEAETLALLQVPLANIASCPRDQLADHCELVIVVGGDGSILGAARSLCRQQLPVLGINRGSLGFLTDIAPDDMEAQVAEVLMGSYVIEERFMLGVQVRRSGLCHAGSAALNEVVLHRGSLLQIIQFDLFLNGQFVYTQSSDGLIVSTPTGSTAYALSGGGPIVHPSLNALALVPMFPHTLSSRPIVIGGDTEVKIIIGGILQEDSRPGSPELSCDGQEHFVLRVGDEIVIRQQPQKLKLVHPLSHDYYQTCRSKLGWGGSLV